MPMQFIVLRSEPLTFNGWREVGRTEASTAADAFRALVMKPGEDLPTSPVGEYLILSMEGSAHLGIEYTLSDLDAEPNPRRHV